MYKNRSIRRSSINNPIIINYPLDDGGEGGDGECAKNDVDGDDGGGDDDVHDARDDVS